MTWRALLVIVQTHDVNFLRVEDLIVMQLGHELGSGTISCADKFFVYFVVVEKWIFCQLSIRRLDETSISVSFHFVVVLVPVSELLKQLAAEHYFGLAIDVLAYLRKVLGLRQCLKKWVLVADKIFILGNHHATVQFGLPLGTLVLALYPLWTLAGLCCGI